MEAKRKRVDLSLSDKVKVINMLKAKQSQTDIAKKIGISQSQVSRVCKSQDEIMKKWKSNDNPERKRQRTGKAADVESALAVWFSNSRGRDVPLSGPVLQEKAQELAKKLNKPNFKATTGWFCRWKTRNGVVYKRLHGEKKDADISNADRWLTDVLPSLFNEYKPEDIFNCDETGIYYRAMPDGTLAHKTEATSGSKTAKDRITALVCANMTGTDKRKLLVIGKSKSPRCFRGTGATLQVKYDANANAWMTSSIFCDWLNAFDDDMKRQCRKVIVVVDNCSAHPNDADKNLQHVKLVFLPPNTTSCIQPCDMGIIRNLKAYYRRRVLEKIIAEIDCSETQLSANNLAKKITLLDAVHMLHQAWRDIKQQTIVNCFRKAGFVQHQGQDDLDGDSDATDAYDLSDVTDVDDLLPSPPVGLTAEEFVQYVEMDATTQCHGMPTDDEICSSVQLASGSNGEPGGDVESGDIDTDTDDAPPTAPTSAEAINALKTVRMWMESVNCPDYSSFYKVENFVQSKLLSVRKQMNIQDYFKSK